MSPLIRQWILLRALSVRRNGATLRELAQEMEVSQKTVRRDLEAFTCAGFPIEQHTGEHGRKTWKLANALQSPGLTFTYDEALSLYLGRRLLDPLAGTVFWDGAQNAFRKIRASLSDNAYRYLEKIAGVFYQTQLGASDYARHSRLIDELLIAIEDSNLTWLTYQSLSATEPATRDVRPYGFVYHRGSLYLVAYDPAARKIKNYKVDRITDVERLKLKFSRPADFNLQTHFSSTFGVFRRDGPPITIRVRFLPPVTRYIQESKWHPSQKLTLTPDGSLLAEFHLSATEEIKSWLLSFGPHAIVLEPETLKNEIITDLQKTLEVYKCPHAANVEENSESKT